MFMVTSNTKIRLYLVIKMNMHINEPFNLVTQQLGINPLFLAEDYDS